VWKTGARRSMDSASRKSAVSTPEDMRVGPVIQTPSVAPVDGDVAAIQRRCDRAPVSPRRAAATAVAQEDEPEASVIPVPRSQTRMRRWSGR
jgi:hypothetical protein